MKSKLFLTVAAASLILLSGCGDQAAAVNTYSLTTQSLSRTSEQNGRIVSAHGIVPVQTALTELPVAEVLCRVGHRVNEGDILFRLDGTALQEQISQLDQDADTAKQKSELKYQYAAAQLEQAKESMAKQLQALQRREQELQNAASQLRRMYQDTNAQCESMRQTVNQLAETLNAMQPDAENYSETEKEYSEAAGQYSSLCEIADSLALQVAQTEAELHDAEQNTESTRLDLEKEISDQEYELKTMQNDAAGSDAQALEKLRQQCDSLTVTAPCAGIVSECFGTSGQLCDGLLAKIMPDDAFSVQLYVPDQVVLALKTGQKASFRTDASAEAYTCTVSDISAVRDVDGFAVRLQPQQQDGLLIGMQAYVTLILEEKEACAVPNTAVRYTDDGSVCVYTAELQADGKEIAVRHDVKTGIVDQDYTEIISDELQQGAQIILEPSDVYDGAAVTRTETESQHDQNT